MATPAEQDVGPAAAQGAEHTNGNQLPLPSPAVNGITSFEPPTQSQGAVDVAETPAQQASPAKGKAKGRGRGRGPAKSKAKITKPTGRGRRQKVFESIKVQAVHERLGEIKSAWTSLARLVKPALEELADRSLKKLSEEPTAHEDVPEAAACHNFLDQRLTDTLNQAGRQFEADVKMESNTLRVNRKVTRESYINKVLEAEEDMYDAMLLRLDRLEHLHDNELPVDLPDTSYAYKDITQTQVDLQDGFVHLANEDNQFTDLFYLQERGYWLRPKPRKPGQKRTAEEKLEDHPCARKPRGGGAAIPQMLNHADGLLSAVEEVENRSSTPPDQGTAAPAEVAEVDVTEEVNGLLVPRPSGPPDELGFRMMNRKERREYTVLNRIMGPASIVWDEDEIGFRDSTNNPEKGATKARRGMYLDKPNSNLMFYDKRCRRWWADEQDEGDLDQELVAKHGLHPRMGIFLPGSSNESEPPKDVVSGDRPIVCVGPKGQVFHASRSTWGMRLDAEVAARDKKMGMRSALQDFCTQESIPEEEIEPSQEVREDYRRSVLLSRGVDPDVVSGVEEPWREGHGRPQATERWPESALRSTITANPGGGLNQILEAASALEAEGEVNRAPPTARSKSQSRPYDAIRDVFTDNAPRPPSARPAMADTYNLSLLAELAEDQPRTLDAATYNPPPPSTEMSMLDPRLFSQSGPCDGPRARFTDVAQPSEYARANALQWPNEFSPQSHRARSHEQHQAREPVRENDFLRTALNPQPTSYAPIAPAPPAPPARGPSPPPQRVPFSNPGAARGSLPALRPVRALLEDPLPFPEPQGSPSPMLRHGMMASNSGAYYPPAPARPFHSGYSIADQPQMTPMQPALMPGQHQLPPPPPLQPGQPGQGQFMQSPASYPMSPPSYQTSPPPISGSFGPILQPGQARQAPGALPRAHPGSPPAPSRYRKLEPAPTPAHRMGHQSNGQELRTVPFDYREAIKDYSAIEAPPRHGPTHIRGWTHNNIKGGRAQAGKGDAAAPEDPS